MSEPLVPPPPISPPPRPPHPYQAAGFYDYHAAPTTVSASQSQLHPGRYPGGISSTSSIDGEAEKISQVQNTYLIHHHHHHHHHPLRHSLPPPPHPPRPPSPVNPMSAILKFRAVLLFIAFLPIPPLLSVIYILIGHSIFRRAASSIQWSAPLLSSANAGAAGGIILTLPLALLLFILLAPPPPAASSPTREAHEDFFDDDDESRVGVVQRAGSYATNIICAGLALGVGGAAGPLGVTCLGSGEHGTPVGADGRVAMLTPGKAAEAGIVGGVVMLGGFIGVAALGGQFNDASSTTHVYYPRSIPRVLLLPCPVFVLFCLCTSGAARCITPRDHYTPCLLFKSR
ncbi:hypothetical protein Hypma_010489 [Hypsizygus marmoreus]|uniref:Uncharacterized protein n=1 Tax=Hypsizygus marmoreus TaxID=39966 RepID=A0A369JUE2_HYPMA|nr:hypothetical protein Hypma_010489 [Hypsizygus marmoreus]